MLAELALDEGQPDGSQADRIQENLYARLTAFVEIVRLMSAAPARSESNESMRLFWAKTASARAKLPDRWSMPPKWKTSLVELYR